MRRRVSLEADPARERRARDWELTAVSAFLAALAMIVWATGNSGWNRGDLLAGIYFGVLGVALWTQGQRVRFGRSGAPFTRVVAVTFTGALLAGALLVVAAIASSGSL